MLGDESFPPTSSLLLPSTNTDTVTNSKSPFIEHILCARHSTKKFLYVILLKLHKTL